MSERVTIRLNDGLRARLSDTAKARGIDLSSVVRQAVIAALDRSNRPTSTAPPVHDREACAQMILEGCPLDVRREISIRLRGTGLSLADWLESMLWCSVAPFDTQALQQGVEPSTILHEALVLFLDRASRAQSAAGSLHRSEDCARVVLEHCPPAVQTRMADAIARARASLMQLLPVILQCWTDAARNPRAWTPER
jgi:hypothetical protein